MIITIDKIYLVIAKRCLSLVTIHSLQKLPLELSIATEFKKIANIFRIHRADPRIKPIAIEINNRHRN